MIDVTGNNYLGFVQLTHTLQRYLLANIDHVQMIQDLKGIDIALHVGCYCTAQPVWISLRISKHINCLRRNCVEKITSTAAIKGPQLAALTGSTKQPIINSITPAMTHRSRQP